MYWSRSLVRSLTGCSTGLARCFAGRFRWAETGTAHKTAKQISVSQKVLLTPVITVGLNGTDGSNESHVTHMSHESHRLNSTRSLRIRRHRLLVSIQKAI